jgi:hypothetical protein
VSLLEALIIDTPVMQRYGRNHAPMHQLVIVTFSNECEKIMQNPELLVEGIRFTSPRGLMRPCSKQ